MSSLRASSGTWLSARSRWSRTREHVAREAGHRIGRGLRLFGLEPAAHVLRLGRGVERLRLGLLQLALELGDAVVLGKLGRGGGRLGADGFGFVVEVVLFIDHCIYLVKAWAVKSTMGTTRA